MRRAAFVLALVIGLMGVMVLPIQAHDGSADSRVDTRNDSNNDSDSSRESSVRSRSDDNTSVSNIDDRNRGHRSRRLIRLSGANEVPVPAGDADGIGWARVSVRPDEGTVCYVVKVKRLDAITAAHIHVGAAGTNGGVVVDLAILTADTKVTGNSTLYSDCIEGLDATLLTSIKENRAGYYLNVHTTTYPDGAIRGQLGKVVSS